LMGGEMSLESELGEGTTFEIILPLKTPEAVPATG
jgi:signal transduction histidine kinase